MDGDAPIPTPYSLLPTPYSERAPGGSRPQSLKPNTKVLQAI